MENLKLSAHFEPSMALVIYQNLNTSQGLSEYYIESHDIHENEFGAGKPLTEDCFSDLSDFILETKSNAMYVGGVIPVELLYYKVNLKGWPDMIWHVKAGPQQMYFAENLNIPNGTANNPSLVFAWLSGSTYVFAVKGSARPDTNTQLYEPPFHNCAKDGNICLGSAKLLKPSVTTWKNLMKYHETRFWKSIFSHNGAAGIKGNLNLVWKDLIENPTKKFDTSKLIKCKLLKDII